MYPAMMSIELATTTTARIELLMAMLRTLPIVRNVLDRLAKNTHSTISPQQQCVVRAGTMCSSPRASAGTRSRGFAFAEVREVEQLPLR